MIKSFLIFILLILVSCGESKPPPNPEVFEIKNIGELATSEYTVGKIVKLDDSDAAWYKPGDRKILINCKAKIKAGIDLNQIKNSDIIINGRTIEITIPAAKVISFTMDSKYSYTAMESVSGLRDSFTQEEKNDFLRQGEKAIKKELKNTKILDEATKNAEMFIENFYKRMGYEEVIVNKTIPE